MRLCFVLGADPGAKTEGQVSLGESVGVLKWKEATSLSHHDVAEDGVAIREGCYCIIKRIKFVNC